MSRSQNEQTTKERVGGKLLAAWNKTKLQANRMWDKTRTAASEGWDKSRIFFDKARVAVARHPVSPLLYVTVLSVAIGAVAFNGMYSRAYVLNVDGEEVGVITDEAELDAIDQQMADEIEAAYEFADSSPYPDPGEAFTDVYSEDNERCVAR